MANYPAKVWNGTSWLGVGTQIADLSPYALKDGSNMAGYGAWTSYTPVLTSTGSTPTLGSGSTQTGRYTQIGKTIHCYSYVRFGSSGTAAGTGTYLLNLPVLSIGGAYMLGSGYCYNNGTVVPIIALTFGQDKASFTSTITGAYVTYNAPFAWGANMEVVMKITYEAA